MPSNRVFHRNEPRNVAYSKENEKYYSKNREMLESYVRSDGSTIFAGATQRALFLFCLGLAKYYEKGPKEIKIRVQNIPTDAMGNSGKWLILGTGMVEYGDLNCLNDESPLYLAAEQYAEAGFDIFQSLLRVHGEKGFSEYLEDLLKKIAEEKKCEHILSKT